MYKILLKNTNDTYSYHQVEVEDPDNSNNTIMEDFDAEDLDELETECIKLLYKYNASQIVPIADVKYSVDLLWNDPDDASKVFPGLVVNGNSSPNPVGKNVKFKILIKSSDNVFNFYQIDEEIMATSATGVTVGTGRYNKIDYEATGFVELEQTSLELLKTYPYTYVSSVICLEFIIDLLWINIDGLTIAMQQQLYDIASATQILDTIKGNS